MIDFLYQELATPRADAFKAHLATCPRCGQELQSLQRVRGAVRELPEAEPPQGVTAKLLHEAAKRAKPLVKDEQRGGFAGWIGSFFKPIVANPAWAAAASLVIVLGAVVFFKSRGVDEKSQAHPGMSAPESKSAPRLAEKPADMTTSAPTAGSSAPAVAASPPAMDPSATDKLGADPNVDGKLRFWNDADAERKTEETSRDRAARAVSDEEAGELELARKKSKAAAADDGDGFLGDLAGQAGKGGNASRGYSPGGSGATSGRSYQDKSGGEEGGVIGGVVGDTGATSIRESKPTIDVTKRSEIPPAPKPLKKASKELEAQVAAEPDDDAMEVPTDAPEETVYRQGPAEPSPDPASKGDAYKEGVKEKTAKKPVTTPPPVKPSSTTPLRERTVAKTESKNAPAKDAKNVEQQKVVQDPKKLHEQAKAQANSGECSKALSTRSMIQKVDTDYYNRNVRNDTVFAPCDRRVQEQRKKAKHRDDEMDSPAPSTDQPAKAK